MFSSPLLRVFSRSAVLLRAATSAGVGGGRGPRRPPLSASGMAYPRLHGTVTGFKHRRGYGFILAEGVVGASQQQQQPPEEVAKLMTGYFFTRNGLMGGHYITEGERVSFDVQERGTPDGKHGGPPIKPHYVALEGEAAIVDDVEAAGPAASADGAAAEASAEKEKPLNVAVSIRMIDLKTNTESPVTPIGLRGKVVRWDAARGVGLVGELDTQGNYHADAPKFFLCLDDVDVNPGSSLRVGRYVRFCLENEEDAAAAAGDADGERATDRPQNTTGLPVARRVIVDRAMETRMAVVGKPLAPAGAPAGTVTARSRFEGTVRDVNLQFGFVTDELSGESIFFHRSNASGSLAPGDRVSYMLRELTRGKHAGKKACFNVRRVRAPRPSVEEMEEADFDVLDIDEEAAHTDDETAAVSSRSGSTVGPASAAARSEDGLSDSEKTGKRTAAASRGGKRDEDDFDLLG